MPSLLRCPTLAIVLSLAAAATCAPAAPPSSKIELVKAFDDFKVIGLAVSRSGRIFASAPAALTGDKVIEIDPRTGATHAFPGQDWRAAATGHDPWFAPQALWIDENDDLWVLDSGRPTLPTSAPTGAPKLIQFDLATNRIKRSYRFDGVVAEDDSLNDVRIDLKRRQAYLANIGRSGSLVVLDLATGRSRQVLVGDRSTRADPYEHPMFGNEYALLPNGEPLTVHADGISLSPDGNWLYYRTLTDHNYWRIATLALADARLSEKQLAGRVEFVGRGPITGGIITDAVGRIYGGDLEHGTVVALIHDPAAKTLTASTFVDAADNIAWADGFAIANGYLYIADPRLSETVFKNHRPKRGVASIYRIKLPE